MATPGDGDTHLTNEIAQIQKEKKHKISSKVNQRSGQTTDRLMNDFFTTANVDQNCDELEKKQLKEALSALSERLLLFQNIKDEKLASDN